MVIIREDANHALRLRQLRDRLMLRTSTVRWVNEDVFAEAPAKPIRARWWVVVIVLFAGLGLIGLLIPGDDGSGEEGLATPTTLPAPGTTIGSPPTTSPPTSTTTTVLGYEPFTLSGTGNESLEFGVPEDLATVLEISYSGSSTFTVTTFGEDDEVVDLLVEADGEYEGARAINMVKGDIVASIEVVADGDWSMTATYLGDLVRHQGEASGRGDSVLIMDIAAPAMTIRHDGASDFWVFAWTFQDQGFLVNTTGPVETTVRVPTGGVVIEIEADGNWSLSTSG